jgi:hypothetical protein
MTALAGSVAAAIRLTLAAWIAVIIDYLLEVPRLAALFYIIVFCGLTMMQAPMRGPAVSVISRDR